MKLQFRKSIVSCQTQGTCEIISKLLEMVMNNNDIDDSMTGFTSHMKEVTHLTK